MIEYISTPIFSTFWGAVAMLSIIGINALMAFLALVTFRLRLWQWPLVMLLCAGYLLLNIYYPNTAVAKYHGGQPAAPYEALRLLFTILALSIGFSAIHQAILKGKT